jgi:hypothetical protein
VVERVRKRIVNDNPGGKFTADDYNGIARHDGSGATWNADTTTVGVISPHTSVTSVNKFDSPYGTQVGGNHYAKYVIQPTEYIIKNGLNFCEGNVIKYVTRYRDKNGVEDLKKARHYLDILISELEKGKDGY